MVRPRRIQKRLSNSSRSRRQQRARHKDSLFFKSFEYCRECDADIFIMVRLKQNGQIQFFNSDSKWPPSLEELTSYYPRPKQITWEELATRYIFEDSLPSPMPKKIEINEGFVASSRSMNEKDVESGSN
ncbi:uncharacterized protein ATNIH1004_009477 [Aspergillus tanneri]|uniref:MADS-box domain-containing protein n=1 Tax=Aspergillus tanneri TaxID=1220188 RepID=A0A5M9M6S3_9EURO|nr:uncharacterized protein ATNIH1004_009477 [Aspergillus tanneri]KAA8642725.1 hypothetical protein ATNIH1004_009477 [Aspergillus tanneri]